MKERIIKQKIKGNDVVYTERMYYGSKYYYLHEINGISVPETDPFPKKKNLVDFVDCYNETKDVSLSLRLGFRPEGMSIKDAINLIQKH